MQLVPGRRTPPRFVEIAKAYWLARGKGRDTQERWRIGVCNEAGELAATGELRSTLQVETMLASMKALGFHSAQILGAPEDMHGCDFLFECMPGHDGLGLEEGAKSGGG
jgi:hypothetical protein